MSPALSLSCRPPACLCTNMLMTGGATPALVSFPVTERLLFFQDNQRSVHVKPRIIKKKPEVEVLDSRKSRGFPFIVSSSIDEEYSVVEPTRVHHMVTEFYHSINKKNTDKIYDALSEDCYFEDCSFLQPFKGREEAMSFFEQLVKSMGQNVNFVVESVCEEDGIGAAVAWHLEWKHRQIPCTRGSSFFEISSEVGKRPVIKKARVLIESPIKPGAAVLVLLKNLTHFFDRYPKIAEWFLEKFFVILRSTARIYFTFLAPFVNRILAGYLIILSVITEIFLFFLKIFFK